METERVEGRFRDWRDPEERRADTILTKISELVFLFLCPSRFCNQSSPKSVASLLSSDEC